MHVALRTLLASLLVVPLGCVDPKDRRPGLWLSGEEVNGPVEDWSFSDAYPEIFLETGTWYGVPHSVTIVCASLEGRLYLWARHPDQKRWVENVARDPEVRLQIGDRLYAVELEPVADPEERERAYRAFAAKYGSAPVPPEERPPLAYFRVAERD